MNIDPLSTLLAFEGHGPLVPIGELADYVRSVVVPLHGDIDACEDDDPVALVCAYLVQLAFVRAGWDPQPTLLFGVN